MVGNAIAQLPIPTLSLNPASTKQSKVFGSATNDDETIGSYYTSNISYKLRSVREAMFFNHGDIGTSATPKEEGNVTLTDNGSTVTLDNNIVSVVINKSSGQIIRFNYNGANILSGGYRGGSFYWSWNMPNYQNPNNCSYTLTADPSSNGNTYAEIKLHMPWSGSTNTAAMDLDIYYSLTNVSGIYATAKLSHPSSYPSNPGGEFRMAAYIGSTYNRLTVDSIRNREMPTQADLAASVKVPGAPKEVMRFTSGIFKDMYDCKYDYSADFGDVNTWGWSSTSNYTGVWMTAPSKEYYPGGPMKRELMCHATPVLLNMLGGTHYGMGTDGQIAAGENWSKMYGPFLIYCNNVPTGTPNSAKLLWDDANSQALAEQAQWPYSWLTDTEYVKSSGRGTVTGSLFISDGDSTPSPANIWVGIAVTPLSTSGITDFQLWSKNYQFWVKTDDSGNFSIPEVLPGTYNIYAFGPSAIGYMSKTNFLTVTAGETTALGTITWTPDRVAPTIWEIGIPDRTSKEFKHGDDYWMETAIYPDTTWANFEKYSTEFPDDVNYTIGTSNPAFDWNYVQPFNVIPNGQTIAPEWKVNFTLTNAPTEGSTSSIYVAAASSFMAPMYVKVNGTNITTPATGVNFPNRSNATIRMANHGAFSDLRFNFPSNLLVAGDNVISFTNRKTGGDIQYDYLRLESLGTSSTFSYSPKYNLFPSIADTSNISNKNIAYPNIASSIINVQFFATKTGIAKCTIIDTKGCSVKQFEVNVLQGKNLMVTDVSNLKAGMYFIQVKCNNKAHTIKFIKQ